MPTNTVTAITMPQLGESVTEGTIGTWLKQVGDRIAKYDPLVEIESDKVSSELPASLAGVLVEILVEPGTTVAVGTALCRIEETETSTDPLVAPLPSESTSPESHNGRRGQSPFPGQVNLIRISGEIPDEMHLLQSRSSPVVRRIAEEHGLEITSLHGTGVGGRVTKRDVMAHLARLSDSASTPPQLHMPRPQPVSATPDQLHVLPGDEVVPLTPMRRAIAANMVRSAQTAPHATVVMEVDMTPVVTWRTARKEDFRHREGIDLTYLPIILKAVTLALREHPRLNAVWDETRIIHRREISIGVAVALDDGLVVPVIRNADRLSISGLAHALAELADKARSGALTPGDISGGTFTVNNPGTFGSLVSTPILVQPQVAILSTEAIIKRPVVVDDMIGIRSMMNLSLSIDHRALDGLAATRFLQQVRHWLEGFSDNLARDS